MKVRHYSSAPRRLRGIESPLRAAASLIGALSLSFIQSAAASGVQQENAEVFTLGRTEELDEEIWLRADEANFEGVTKEDISVWARTVNLAGRFEGDIWVLGTERVTFSGAAAGQIRLAGPVVEMKGEADRSLVAIGAVVNVGGESHIRDTAALLGDSVTIDGQFDENLFVYANKATIQGEIRGTLRLVATDIVILPGTRIDGDLVYSAPRELVPGSKVTIGGEIRRSEAPFIGISSEGLAVLKLAFFTACVLIALPYIRWMPKASAFGIAAISRTPGRSLLVGLLAASCLPAFAAISFHFLLTAPFGLVLLALLFLLMFVSVALVSLTLGGLIYRRLRKGVHPRAIPSFLIGLVVLYIVTFVPILSLVIWGFIWTVGIGGTLLGLWASQQDAPIGVSSPADLEENETDTPRNFDHPENEE